jgi:hypothetical protein
MIKKQKRKKSFKKRPFQKKIQNKINKIIETQIIFPHEENSIELDVEAWGYVEELRTLYENCNSEIAGYVEQIESLQKKLKKIIGNKQFALHNKEIVYSWYESAVRKCEFNKLKEDLPEIYKEYITLIKARRFKVAGYRVPIVQIYPYNIEELKDE